VYPFGRRQGTGPNSSNCGRINDDEVLAEGSGMDDGTVRIGIIGIGGMGRHHAKYLKAGDVEGATLAAVADVSPAALDWARTSLGEGVARFPDAESLFAADAVDAVMIATPHYFHPPLAVAAFGHGLHALVEKPAGVYTKQVREMNEAAARTDRVFGIMFNQRTSGFHQKMKEIVASGQLGEIQRTSYTITDWFRTQAYYDSGGWRATWAGEGGGVLVNQCPHNLDLWQWICGMPARVRAFCGFGRFHDIEVEDAVTAYVEYPNGATGVFITTTGEAPGTNVFEIVGDKGRLRLTGGDKLDLTTLSVSSRRFIRESDQGFARPDSQTVEIAGGGGEGHVGITRNWVAAIRGGKPLLASGQEGIHGVQLANAMLLSAWTDGWVDIPVDEDLYWQKLQERVAASAGKQAAATPGKAMEFAGTF
jgi:predicted dehydrogenase